MIIRLILTVLLLVGVYSETGKWTLTFCIFATIAFEMIAHKLKVRPSP